MTNEDFNEMTKVLDGKESRHILNTAYVYLSLKGFNDEASLVNYLDRIITEKSKKEYMQKYGNK